MNNINFNRKLLILISIVVSIFSIILLQSSAPHPKNPFTGSSNGLQLNVSAFLTGRIYSGTGDLVTTTFEDDELATVKDLGDAVLGKGLFYVNDPTNDMTNTFPPLEPKWGYNDLEMRKMRMCQLLQLSCLNGSVVISVIHAVSQQPMPYG